MSCFRAWEDWAVYPNDYLIKLQNIFLGLVPYKVCCITILLWPAICFHKYQRSPDGLWLKTSFSQGEEEPVKEDIDGAPLDVDGTPLDDLDGAPLDGGPAPLNKGLVEDYDGKLLVHAEGSPYNDDLDGLPLSAADKPNVDGQAIPEEKSMTKFKYEPSKWESVDETQLEAQGW